MSLSAWVLPAAGPADPLLVWRGKACFASESQWLPGGRRACAVFIAVGHDLCGQVWCDRCAPRLLAYRSCGARLAEVMVDHALLLPTVAFHPEVFMSVAPVRTYRVVLLPKQEVAAAGLSLREAQAWVNAYNQVMRDARRQAVIAEEHIQRDAA